MDAMFRKSLADLVRGIRANKKNEKKYIQRAMNEIKEELKLVNKKAKMVAVQKLTYLHMLGYDMSWAAFNVVECMSYPLFTAKRIGYLAAGQCFSKDTEVSMLTTNLFRKDLSSVNTYETSVAINCLSNIATPDLARDLAPDIVALIASSRPYIRKRAVLGLYKVCLQFPQALRPAYPRLKEKLEDPDPGVVCAAVNVICELARKNPKNYLTLVPVLFKILTMSNNNWMLIKLVKLFGSLAPLEKRLGKKLVEPLSNIMNSTTAMSLLYECIQTCTIGLTAHPNVIRLCVTKLRLFIEDPDQNLKYLGLRALHKLMPIAPKAVQEHRETVLSCLDDDDITIKRSALYLIEGMITKKNIVEIIRKLMDKLDDADYDYRDSLVQTIIKICSQNNYQYIQDFDWYVGILVQLTHIRGTTHGRLISDQLMDVCIRVSVVRESCVKQMVRLLYDTRLTDENPTAGGVCEVLYAAAWCVGEYGQYCSPTEQMQILQQMLHARMASLPGHIQSIFIQNSMKMYIRIYARNPAETEEATKVMKNSLSAYVKSTDLETQERACFCLELVKLIGSLGATSIPELQELFKEALNPVAPRAQKKVPVPDGLDLDKQIHTPPSSDDEEEEYYMESGSFDQPKQVEPREVDQAELEYQRKKRRQRRANDPFYLGGKQSDDEEYPPVEVLTPDMLNLPPGALQEPQKRKKKRAVVVTTFEMPEGADDGDSDDGYDRGADPFADVDLSKPVKPEEELQVASYPMPTVGYHPDEKPKKERRKKRRRRRDAGQDDEDVVDDRKEARRKRRERKGKGAAGKTDDVGDLLNLSGSGAPAATQQEVAPSGRKKRSGSTKRGKGGAAAAGAVPIPGPGGFILAKETPEVKLGYVLGVNPQQPDKILVTFHIKGEANLSEVNFSVTDTSNTKLAAGSNLKPNLSVRGGDVGQHQLLFAFQSFTQPQHLSATLSFNSPSGAKSVPFPLVIPCSTFLQPQQIAQRQFEQLMADSSLKPASAKVACKDAREALNKITNHLHLHVVGVTNLAMLYGQSTQRHHFCMAVKNQNGELQMEVRCSDAAFATNLLAEVQQLF